MIRYVQWRSIHFTPRPSIRFRLFSSNLSPRA